MKEHWESVLICLACWRKGTSQTKPQPERTPHRVIDSDPETCYFCKGPTTHGIYVRADTEKK